MRHRTVLVALLLLLSAPPTRGHAADLHEVGIVPRDTPETQDKPTHDACDCCQNCKAAKSAIKSKHQEGAAMSDGCDDCCARCGKVLQPTQQEAPPEIIEKHTPPDIIDKNKP
jgi:hypothetical protein